MSFPNPKRNKGRSQIGAYTPISDYDIERKDLTMSDAAKVNEHCETGDLTVKLEAALRATSHVQTTEQGK
jgi:hypothetical protein